MFAVGFVKGWLVSVKAQGGEFEAHKDGESVVLESPTIDGLKDLIDMREGQYGEVCSR